MASHSLPYILAPTAAGTLSTRTSVTRFDMDAAASTPDIDADSARIAEVALDVSQSPKPENEAVAQAQEPAETAVPQTPQAHVTFLVVSGRRRTMAFDPETTIGRVKELVWNAWPSEWEDERPLAPSYLRLLYLGKMLQDDDTLAKLKFPTNTPHSSPIPTIVHLSVRPFALPSDGDIKKKRKSRNSDSARTGAQDESNVETGGCCGCVIC